MSIMSRYVLIIIEINRMESTMKTSRQNALIFSFTFMAFILGTTEYILEPRSNASDSRRLGLWFRDRLCHWHTRYDVLVQPYPETDYHSCVACIDSATEFVERYNWNLQYAAGD